MSKCSGNADYRHTVSLSSMLAKTIDGGEGMNILTHSVLTGVVAQELIARLSLPITSNQIFQFQQEIALVAALHDVGKINISFQKRLRGEKLACDRSKWGYHAGISRLFAKHYFREKHREERSPQSKSWRKYIPDIIGRHHGWEVEESDRYLDDLMDPYLFGGDRFQEIRLELLTQLQKLFGKSWITVQDLQRGWVVSGLVSVADWIASSLVCADLKQHDCSPTSTRIATTTRIVQEKLDNIGFTNYSVIEGLSFSDVFGGFTPNLMQEKAIEMIKEPGVYIIETEMGQGKTEAALYAAYQLLSSKQARGIYFALPTRLTSQKLYTRFDAFIDRILEPEKRVGTKLIHSSSQLHNFGSPEVTEIGEDGELEYRWFLNKRRALLAPFGVGTIDQALLSVLTTKFWFVRAFALAGKVVVLDEVHSYDIYTGTIMDEMIETLLKFGCTVIILSATLTRSRVKGLLYGRDARKQPELPSPYPSLSARPVSFAHPEICPVEGGEPKEVVLDWCEDDQEGRRSAVETALNASAEGQQVLWIENTVGLAQESYTILAARAGGIPEVDVGLIHSRFLPGDRGKLEQKWIDRYGRKTPPERPESGNILVGTQVLEQSLDIDADLLITAIAPTDMLIQRLGRLWRHPVHHPLRPDGAERRCIILSPGREAIFGGDVMRVFGSAGLVYSPYVLARTFIEWEAKRTISLPGEIREILERTYAEPESEAPHLLAARKELEKESAKLKSMANIATSSNSSKLSEQKATTRYYEQPARDVVLVKRFRLQDEELSVEFLDGSLVTLTQTSSITDKKASAKAIMLNMLSVPSYIAPENIRLSGRARDLLSQYIYLDKNEEECTLFARVDEAGRLHWEGNEDPNSKYRVTYRKQIGYNAEKKEEVQVE